MSVYSGTKQDGWNEYMLYGGLPLVLRFEKPEEKGNVGTCNRDLLVSKSMTRSAYNKTLLRFC